MGMQEKLNKAYDHGFSEACDFFDYTLSQTKGVGPVIRNRILSQVKKQIREAVANGILQKDDRG